MTWHSESEKVRTKVVDRSSRQRLSFDPSAHADLVVWSQQRLAEVRKHAHDEPWIAARLKEQLERLLEERFAHVVERGAEEHVRDLGVGCGRRARNLPRECERVLDAPLLHQGVGLDDERQGCERVEAVLANDERARGGALACGRVVRRGRFCWGAWRAGGGGGGKKRDEDVVDLVRAGRGAELEAGPGAHERAGLERERSRDGRDRERDELHNLLRMDRVDLDHVVVQQRRHVRRVDRWWTGWRSARSPG